MDIINFPAKVAQGDIVNFSELIPSTDLLVVGRYIPTSTGKPRNGTQYKEVVITIQDLLGSITSGISSINGDPGPVVTLGVTATPVGSPLQWGGVTLQLPLAGATTAFGILSSADWTAFNNKVDGSGTINQVAKFTAAGTIGNGLITDNGTSVFYYGVGAITSNTSFGENALAANTTGAFNIAYGAGALNGVTTGSYGTAVGYQALASNNADYNTAFGYRAAYSNTTGQLNTAVGWSALLSNTTASQNTAVGLSALQNTTTGGENTAVGREAMIANVTGIQNTALGAQALGNPTAGNYNVAIGYQALQLAGSGIQTNVAIGYRALWTTTTDGSTAVGNGALSANTSGVSNAAFGALALYSNTTGSQNTAIGYGAFQSGNGTDNTALGWRAGFNNTGSQTTAIGSSALYNNTGSYNTAVGMQAMYTNTSGAQNVAIGVNALFANSIGNYHTIIGTSSFQNNTGTGNTSLGFQAGYLNVTGNYNVYLGYSAGNAETSTTGAVWITPGNDNGYFNTDGNIKIGAGAWTTLVHDIANNIAIGNNASRLNHASDVVAIGGGANAYNSTGTRIVSLGTGSGGAANWGTPFGASNFTAIGYNALTANKGDYNTALGYSAGITNTTGTHNLFLGDGADASGSNFTNAVAIGSGASVGASNSMVLGNGLHVGVGVSVPTAWLHLPASTTAEASLNLTTGVAPTTPNNQDVWATSTEFFMYQGGVTKNINVSTDGAAAPGTNAIGVILDYYGTSATRVLTTPNSWETVVINGTTYKRPLYT